MNLGEKEKKGGGGTSCSRYSGNRVCSSYAELYSTTQVRLDPDI